MSALLDGSARRSTDPLTAGRLLGLLSLGPMDRRAADDWVERHQARGVVDELLEAGCVLRSSAGDLTLNAPASRAPLTDAWVRTVDRQAPRREPVACRGR